MPLEVLPFGQSPGYSRVIPDLLIPVTGTSNTILAKYLGPGYPGASQFTLEIPGIATYHPLNHVPWVVFRSMLQEHIQCGIQHALHTLCYYHLRDARVI